MSSESRVSANRVIVVVGGADKGSRASSTLLVCTNAVSKRDFTKPSPPRRRVAPRPSLSEKAMFSSNHRTLINRQNASHSTGPRTPKGKLRSSRNAVKHGLTAKTDVIPGDLKLGTVTHTAVHRGTPCRPPSDFSSPTNRGSDCTQFPKWRGDSPRSYKSFRRQLLLELNPTSLLERELAGRIIGDLWRLKRVPKLESAIMREMRTRKNEPALALAELAIALDHRRKMGTAAYHGSLVSSQTVDMPLSPFFRTPQSSRDKGRRAFSPSLSRSALADKHDRSHPSTGWLDYSDHFARFSRYESSLERSLFRCLKEYRNWGLSHTEPPTAEPRTDLHQTPSSQPTKAVTVPNSPTPTAESALFPTPKLHPRRAPLNSHNPHSLNHFRHSLYHTRLASFRNSARLHTAQPTYNHTYTNAFPRQTEAEGLHSSPQRLHKAQRHQGPRALGPGGSRVEPWRSDNRDWACGPVGSFCKSACEPDGTADTHVNVDQKASPNQPATEAPREPKPADERTS